MLGKMCPFRITESCIKVRKSITTDYVTGATRFIGSHGRFRFRREWTKKQSFKPRANGSNSVGQQLPTLFNVTCCVCLYTLLHVVACCWELLRKVWNRSNFYLRANGRNNSQHCWPTMLGVVASVCTQLYKVTYLAKRSVKLNHIDILLLQKREWTNYIDYKNCINWGNVTREDSQGRFLAQHSVAMLEQCCIHSKQ